MNDDVNAKNFNGWVTRCGDMVQCGSYVHIEAARKHGTMSPDNAGWVHYTLGRPLPVSMRRGSIFISSVTQRQLDVMYRIAIASNMAPESWFTDIEVE